jgi:preprotein translocase subunit SecF
VVNKRINQTLSRTILTSGLTFLTVVSLYLFGGEVINGFAFALVVGIIIGTYSSIAIASPLLVIWNDYKGKKKELAKVASY